MPDFAAVKELVEQRVDSYRCSRASITGPSVDHSTSLTGVASSSWIKCTKLSHLVGSSFRISAVTLSLSTVKHGSFLFAYFLDKLKNNLKTVHAWGCIIFFYISYSC